MTPPRPPVVLSIAGSDPSGGAGIQADLKTCAAFGTYGMAAITALTAQNTRGVTGVHVPPGAFLREQIRAVLSDIPPDAVKTGMLPDAGVIGIVADELTALDSRAVVVDPVMVATSGDRLVDEDAAAALRERLFPLAAVITPNREEAEVLTGRDVRDPSQARAAGRELLATGPGAVLVKGVEEGEDLVDLLVTSGGEHPLRHRRLDRGPTHGTGCTLSTALACLLAFGHELPEAARGATDYVWRAIRAATPLGDGALPLDHRVPADSKAP